MEIKRIVIGNLENILAKITGVTKITAVTDCNKKITMNLKVPLGYTIGRKRMRPKLTGDNTAMINAYKFKRREEGEEHISKYYDMIKYEINFQTKEIKTLSQEEYEHVVWDSDWYQD